MIISCDLDLSLNELGIKQRPMAFKLLRNDTRMKQTYMGVALKYAEASYAIKKKVGAIIVRNYHQLSEGFNGTPANFDNRCEDDNFVTYPWVVHAEANAILKLAKNSGGGEGAAMFSTVAPCERCAGMIITAGIKEVYYLEEFKRTLGLELLKRANIYIEQLYYPPT